MYGITESQGMVYGEAPEDSEQRGSRGLGEQRKREALLSRLIPLSSVGWGGDQRTVLGAIFQKDFTIT